ncbi:hypothetical protein J7560_04980 [Wohlfahrtiimonas chitiniclastica]|uniref:hypothetical protein n=1 Tax=Wohlfahrtiimonas chitiniclastica TaxID=400946 RepID=UPI001BCDABA3|nr:hypothetical protein [Wohlfahrtiimonas chitiniclastica]MBS7814773.1 hypothetical protein [Wohlfahrtiimonas chitiniclastica]
MSVKRLIKEYSLDQIDTDHIQDALSLLAANIENSLLSHGAEPGKDYTYIDLYNLAMRYLLADYPPKDSCITFGTIYSLKANESK